jgi:predicted RecA/RadA family phage recombinase
MAKNFIQDGRYLEVTAPAGLSSGDFVKVGSVFGFAQNDALSGAAVQIDTAGVHSIACASAAVIAVGDPLYWDVADGEVNKTASGNWYVGVAASAAGNGVTSVDIRLNGSMPAAAGA